MTSPSEPLPALHMALLDGHAVTALFVDLLALTEVLEVVLKGGPQQYALTHPVTLERAQGMFQRGEVVGLQVRYRHDARAWCDTLLRTPDGVRLVRVADVGGHP
ncbi:MAG: hypothetical protein AB2A00_28125 [Myxococcota bacterium]